MKLSKPRPRFDLPVAMIGAALALCLLTIGESVQAQGCVAVRPMSCGDAGHMSMSNGSMVSGPLVEGRWDASASYQYFRSFRHFRGDHEESHRVDDGTEVININHAMDLGISYSLNRRTQLTINVPLIYYDRSSLYEHYGNSIGSNPGQQRFNTGSYGLGDVRLSADYWMLDPAKGHRTNFSLGLGIKTPTGDSNVQDTFHKMGSDGADSLVTKAVDQSIQLGDGAWGFALRSQAYSAFSRSFSGYFNGFYLFTPTEVNDTQHNATTFHSVADQYSFRMGMNYAALPAHGLSASLGGRFEGIPSEDLIGGSDGRRRPGYAISIEPGLSLNQHVWNLSLNVPIALYRNRTQSVSDKERTASSGEWVQGDAAFADYVVNFSISRSFGGSSHGMMMGDK